MNGSIVLQVCEEYKIHPNEFFDGSRRHTRLTKARRVALHRLLSAGFNKAAAARLLRINYSTVYYWLNPVIREKRRVYARKYRQPPEAHHA